MGFGHSRILGLGFPTLREGGRRKAIKEAEGLHLGLLSSRDGKSSLVHGLGQFGNIHNDQPQLVG